MALLVTALHGIPGPARRVRTVRLTARNEALVRRGALLLEDALRTASVPGETAGRLVVVRALTVGAIRSSAGPATIALAVEQRLRALAATALHAEHPSAVASAAVYFRDDGEPYRAAAVRLAAGRTTDEWFWPLVLPNWRAGASQQEGLRALLHGALETRAGVAAGIALVETLREGETLPALLAALREGDGPALLRAYGWTRAAPARAPSSTPAVQMPAAWAGTLSRWTVRWGAEDDRSLWLAAVVLAADRPARLLDARLSERAAQIIASCLPNDRGGVEPPSPSAPPRAAIAPAAHRLSVPSDTRRLVLPAGADLDSSGTPERGDRPSAEGVAQHPDGRGAEPAPAGAGAPAVAAPAPEQRQPVAGTAPSSANRVERPPWLESPQETAGAGLLFLLTVLERLGIGDWLESHPDLIDADLPTRLLRHVAVRLGLPPDDPMLAALPPIGAHGPPAASEWLMPAVWWREVTAGGPPVVRLVRSTDGARALFDNSGRLALALWHGPQPDKLRARVAEHAAPPFQPRGRAERRSEPALLRDSWLAAAARWCRRRAGVGLRGLVRRPGRVSWTRTHIDVVFGIEQIDLRVRRAALDVDPGWVPWLGRVVLFHYVPADADEGV